MLLEPALGCLAMSGVDDEDDSEVSMGDNGRDTKGEELKRVGKENGSRLGV